MHDGLSLVGQAPPNRMSGHGSFDFKHKNLTAQSASLEQADLLQAEVRVTSACAKAAISAGISDSAPGFEGLALRWL
jgi:hypothetical protein